MKLGYVVIGSGVLLSFHAAVVPHFSAAYQLQFGTLLLHLLPYLVFAPAVVRLNTPVTNVAGGLLLLVHAIFVVRERLLQANGDQSILFLAVPVLLAILLLPLLVRAAAPTWQTLR